VRDFPLPNFKEIDEKAIDVVSIFTNYLLFLNATEERRKSKKELIEFIDKEIIDSLVYELYFEEELGTNLFEFVEPYLIDIEGISDDETRLKTIEEVVEKIKKDGKVMREVERMKWHEWVNVVCGGGG
jgi:hypothetical protein